ncbi:S8 family serine peptidase, partial [Microcoleus anatoxicus]
GVSADSPYLNYANIKKGRDYVGGDDNPLLKPGEGSEHGTFMLGIIDAINKTAPKWVGRAIDSGRWADSLVEFVDAAKASGQKNAIANLSLDLTQKNADGSVTTRYELTPQERSAIEYARQNGVMLVVAAGNDGGVMSVLGQASQEFDNIFTVGAGDINGRSNYSSYGRGLDILADGGTTEHPALSTAGNDLGTMAGTSVATAKVAGAASLVWAANPALNYRQVMEILKSTARDLGPVGWDDETGFGFLNTLAAVDLAKKTTPEVYKPTAFLKPTTWGGEGLVTPTERAVNIINENFTAWVVSSNGITLRNSPNTSDRSNFVVKTGDTLTFDGWTYGEQLSDLTTGEADALWYRFRYNGGTYWVPSAWTGGYPGSRPPLLPPTQQPPQQPPQQPTANTVYLSTSSGQILQVNTATGAQNPIYQGRAFTDLAVAPNGKLYGCTFYDGLYEINPSTGAERYVGPLAGGSLNSLTFSTDGRLYGADQGNGNLFQISPDNGQMNLIGNLGGPSSGDLVFNGANEILATVSSPNTSLNDRLVAVNLATGNSRYIGDLGLLEVYGLSWENGQLTAYTSDRRKLAIDPNTAKATVVGTVSSNGLIWGAATKPATASSPTDDVRQKFLYAASQYPQVGAAITGMQDQGGGVFRQEFERAIMIWNGQQVTVYETKGRSVSPTSPSPNPQPVNNNINQSVIAALRTAIFGQESGYNYKAVNPNSGALGIAQVMPANIPSWSREALGYQITDNQFLNSPDLQLKIIDYKLNQYYQQAIAASGGNVDIAVRRVASAWYSGNPNKYNSTTPEYTNGVQYPSIANYTLSVLGKFQQAYGGGSSGNTGNNSGNDGGSANSNDPISGKGNTIRTGETGGGTEMLGGVRSKQEILQDLKDDQDSLQDQIVDIEGEIAELRNWWWFNLGSLINSQKIGELESKLSTLQNKETEKKQEISSIESQRYYRDPAVEYAKLYAKNRNHYFSDFPDNNCANFAFQVLLAGGIFNEADAKKVVDGGKSGVYDYTSVEGLLNNLKNNYSAIEVEGIKSLKPGDLIFHIWKEGPIFDHVDVYLGDNKIASNTTDQLRIDWNYDDPKETLDRAVSKKLFLHIS